MNRLKYLLALSLTLLILAGCSSKKDEDKKDDNPDVTEVNSALLKTVGSDAEMVVVINMDQMLTNAGYKRSGSTYEAPEGGYADVYMADMAGFADLASVVRVDPSISSDEDSYYTFAITSTDGLQSYVDSNRLTRLQDRDGYTVYTLDNGRYLMINGQQGWITRTPASVISNVAAASNKHFGQGLAISTSIEQPHTLNVAVNIGSIPEAGQNVAELANGWGIANIDLSGPKVSGTFKTIKSDGSEIQIPGTQNISTDFLKYTKGTPNVALAMGITPKFPWKAIGKLLSGSGDNSMSGYLPFMRMIDGTVAVAISASADSNAAYPAPGFDFMAMIDSKSDPESLMQLINMAAGNKLTPAGDGIYRMPLNFGPLSEIYVGPVDGKFFIATYPPASATGSTDLDSTFSGNDLVLNLNLPPEILGLFINAYDAPGFGLRGFLKSTSSSGSFEFSLTGTDMPLLQALSQH